jgi:hypothetical protein
MPNGQYCTIELALWGPNGPQARFGEQVTAYIAIGNLMPDRLLFRIHTHGDTIADSIDDLIWLDPYEVKGFYHYFTMPNHNSTVTAEGWFYEPMGGLIMDISDTKTITLQGSTTNPVLTIANPDIKPGDVLYFSFTGFTPNTYIYVGVKNGMENTYVLSDSAGNGSDYLVIVIQANGTYILEATDTANYATDTFQVTRVENQWVILSSITTTIPTPATNWVAINTIIAMLPATSWVAINTIAAMLPASSWVAINNIIATLPATSWVVINTVSALLGPSAWIVINSVDAHYLAVPREGWSWDWLTNKWVWIGVAAVAVVAVGAVVLTKKKSPQIMFLSEGAKQIKQLTQ